MNRSKKQPNFFIVGAPKCGTSSMYSYLSSHPDIFFPQVKEPHHFGTDIYSPLYIRDRQQYLGLFSDCGDAAVIGDASVWYLYSKNAAAEIQEFCHDAKILIMLRNPVEMVYSYHSQRLAWGNEDIADFSQALDAESERKTGSLLPWQNPHPVAGLYYSEIAKYATQVERYIKVFGRENIQIILFDDFKKNTAEAYRKVLQFIDVDADYQPEFTVKNPNRSRRNMFLHNLLYHAPGKLITAGKLIVPTALRKPLWRFMTKANTSYERRPEIAVELGKRLRDNYREEILRLSNIINRDLEALWLKDGG